MTLLALRDEIDRLIKAHPEVAELKVYDSWLDTDLLNAADCELDRVILHDPDGEGFTYATVEPA